MQKRPMKDIELICKKLSISGSDREKIDFVLVQMLNRGYVVYEDILQLSESLYGAYKAGREVMKVEPAVFMFYLENKMVSSEGFLIALNRHYVENLKVKE